MSYGGIKDLSRRSDSDKVSRDKAFDIAKDKKCDGYQRGIASMAQNFFDKRSTATHTKTRSNSNSDSKSSCLKDCTANYKKIKNAKSILSLKITCWVQTQLKCS